MKPARGFTLMELAIVCVVLGVVVSAVFATWRALERAQRRSADVLSHVEVTSIFRESLAEDRRTLAWDDAHPADVRLRSTRCAEVRYRVTADDVLVRDAPPACGGDRALGWRVRSIVRRDDLVELHFRTGRGETETTTTMRVGVAP